MLDRPIIAGVDSTAAGLEAAEVASRLVAQTRATGRIVHVLRHHGDEERPGAARRDELAAVAREQLLGCLQGRVAPELLGAVEVRHGRAAAELRAAALAEGAGLIVLGGKHHGILQRWFGGSTVRDLARITPVPLLVTVSPPERFQRVLAPVDLSEAARPTVAAAEAWAATFGGVVRLMHTVEPVPFAAELQGMFDPGEMEAYARHVLDTTVWPAAERRSTERVVRHGSARAAIEEEVRQWHADLVVIGSHGKGWIDRALLGSLTEALLADLPASLLVVPAGAGPPA